MTLYSWFKGTKKEEVFNNSLNRFANNKEVDTHYLKNYTMWPTAKIKATLPINDKPTNNESLNIYPIIDASEIMPEKELTLANKISEQEVIASILAVKPKFSAKKA